MGNLIEEQIQFWDDDDDDDDNNDDDGGGGGGGGGDGGGNGFDEAAVMYCESRRDILKRACAELASR